jgi:hypothetical protein
MAYAQPVQPQQQYMQPQQRPMVQPAMPQQSYAAQAAMQQPQTAPPVYSQHAPAQGYNPARPAAAPAYIAAMPSTPATAPAVAAPSYSYPQQTQPYVAPYAQPRVAMAYQTPTTSGAESVPTAPAETIVPGQPGNGSYMPQPVPTEEYAATQGYQPGAPALNGANCNCQPGSGYESYPGYGSTTPYGACNSGACGYDQPGMMARVLGKHGAGYWFGGVYGLLMDRDSSDKYPLAFANNGGGAGYYPNPSEVVMTSRDVDTDFQGGVEFRLGRTFGGGATDPCGYGCGCGPTWGLEGVYWTLFDEDESASYMDSGSSRTYSMMPMRGLTYLPPSATQMPIHDFWDYAPPVEAADDYMVTRVRASSSFEVQNIEVNLLRLSLCGSSCAAPAVCNVGCDSGSCDTCSGGTCSTGACGTGGYFRGLGSRFSCTGVCGVRYLELDESFMYGVDYLNTNTNASGYVDYHALTENKLVGAQIGCNGMYRIGCKWGLHLNSLVGLYGNDIDSRQYFATPAGGTVYYGGTTEVFDVNADKTDVAMLGELRLGGSYQATCHCRLYGGWRVMGLTGIALAGEQTPNAFLNGSQMDGYVNSNGSMILHGLQTGVEWNY